MKIYMENYNLAINYLSQRKMLQFFIFLSNSYISYFPVLQFSLIVAIFVMNEKGALIVEAKTTAVK